MIYHGTKTEIDFVTLKNSRYGFPCLFFTDSIELASSFAGKSGCIYQAPIPFLNKTVNFNHKPTFSSEYRNLIFKLYQDQINCKIENIYDRPNENYPWEKSTIYVLFNLKNLKKVNKL